METSRQHHPPAIIRLYRWSWRFWKEKRFRQFVETIRPTPQDHLLDIGGYPFNWYGRGGVIGRVDTLNLTTSPPADAPAGTPEIRSITGDARRLPFADDSYGIVFSNSVIEHVGDLKDQAAFAAEARRVGRSLWVQTPARECPIEPHYLGLFLHWLPARWHARCARWFSLRGLTGAANPDELREIAAHTRLLSRDEFAALFPDCEIRTERLFGILPKSYIAIRRRAEKP
jgi:hypothetical protein